MLLKRIRVLAGVLYFILIFVVFFFTLDRIQDIAPIVLFPQVGPALFKLITAFSITACASIGVVLLLTIAFGRVYCAVLCPLGFLNDIISFISRKLGIKKKYSYLRPVPILNHSMLFLSVSAGIIGSLTFIDFIEPYGLFGRFVTQLVRPPVISINNFVSTVLSSFGIYSLPTLEPARFVVPLFFTAFVSFIAILVLAFLGGRLFCTSVCPVGTILGHVSGFSIFKIRLNPEDCTACGVCEKKCRSSCIDSSSKKIDNSRCVMCFDCIAACSRRLISYRAGGSARKPEIVEPGRRKFLIGSVLGAGALIAMSVPVRLLGSGGYKAEKKCPSTPPGSVGVEHFTGACIACGLCADQCPTKVIQPGFAEYGLRGLMQPYMNYREGYCLYECNRCGLVCPAGAILPVSVDEKKRVKIGNVSFARGKCIVITNNQNCGACAEHCPTHAVYTMPEGGLNVPRTLPEICVGCGACEKVCPVPGKAIVVDPLYLHSKAQTPLSAPPEEPGQVKKTNAQEDFPF